MHATRASLATSALFILTAAAPAVARAALGLAPSLGQAASSSPLLSASIQSDAGGSVSSGGGGAGPADEGSGGQSCGGRVTGARVRSVARYSASFRAPPAPCSLGKSRHIILSAAGAYAHDATHTHTRAHTHAHHTHHARKHKSTRGERHAHRLDALPAATRAAARLAARAMPPAAEAWTFWGFPALIAPRRS
jgi:hypothetical protein